MPSGLTALWENVIAQTHFGFGYLDETEKSQRVAGVFDSVADRYDLMNDLMSFGLHRWWKRFMVSQSATRAGSRVLDVAAGTADLSCAFKKRVGATGEVWHTDINAAMLTKGRERLINEGLLLPSIQCDAEALPFPDRYFDCVSVAFGLRNMTHIPRALKEMGRVLKIGGRLMVLEFSTVPKPFASLYDAYSFQVLPWLGKKITGDADSYRYLAESIRMHPDQHTLCQLMRDAGFGLVDYHNLNAGIVALHKGFKL